MGIKFFHAWLKSYHPSMFMTRWPTTSAVEGLAIDMNNLIHIAAQNKYGYGIYEHSPPNPLNLDVIIGQQIVDLVTIYNPRQYLILCVDGVASSAKIFQQRQRRFKSAAGPPLVSFDPNLISPGTPFMHNLCQRIHTWIEHMVNTTWTHLTIHYSPESDPGEGEMKIFTQLKTAAAAGPFRAVWIIYGQDADLILLTLQWMIQYPAYSMYIHRPKARDPTDYEIMNLSQLWDSLPIQTLSNFIYFMTFGGNDFAPTVPGIQLLKDLPSHTRQRRMLRRVNPPTSSRISTFFTEIAKLETMHSNRGDILKHLLQIWTPQEKEYINIHWWPDVKTSAQYTQHRTEYYSSKFGENVAVRDICHAYITAMEWVYAYYSTYTVPDWDYVYPYLYAPFMIDIQTHYASYDKAACTNWRMNYPTTMFKQCLRILPLCSIETVLGPEWVEYLRKYHKEYFPDTIELDMEHKTVEWEAIVIIPNMSDGTAQYIEDDAKIRGIQRGRPAASPPAIDALNDTAALAASAPVRGRM